MSSRICPFCDSVFQSTPLCEGRRPRARASCSLASFNPRPSARGDLELPRGPLPTNKFQSTPLCEGRPGPAVTWKCSRQFQSTPLCEGRLAPEFRDVAGLDVSIHAPLRGATAWRQQLGARTHRFNPRPSARGDRRPRKKTPRGLVSIHAPLRGATCGGHAGTER